jgi:hypothetical protein
MTDVTHEAEIKRSLVLDNGQTIFAIRTDPHGFWRFKVEEGTLPDRWKTAQYTTFDEARKAVVDYCHEKGDRQLVKIDSGRQTAYEAGLGKHDEYNPPVLQTKDNVKKRHVEVAI